MASRRFNQFQQTLRKGLCTLYLKATIGATGAPTLVTANGASLGIKSITRTDTGSYTIVFGVPSVAGVDEYQACTQVTATMLAAAQSATPIAQLALDSSTSGEIKILMTDGASVQDPGNGEVMNLAITLSNSTAI